jgi:predicted ferric reductase
VDRDGQRIDAASVLVALGFLGAAVTLGLWWNTTARASEVTGWQNAVTSMGRISGLLAAYLALVQLLLMARVPLIERAVGLPRITAWHRTLGGETVVLLAVHVGLITYGYSLRHRRGFTEELGHLVTTYPSMLRATIAAVLFGVIGVTSVRLARRALPYELWWAIHLLSYAAVALSVAHSLENGQELTRHPNARVAYVALVLAVIAAAAWWRLFVPLRNSWAHRVRIDEVVRESPDTVSIWLAGEGIERLEAKGGQYVIVRFLARGHWFSGHPYSLSTPPGDGRLRVTIRDLGDHSGASADLRPGTGAIVEGPFGVFTHHAGRAAAPALLIGGGVGITPLRPIAEELAAEGRDVVVVHRGSHEDELILADELADLPVTLHRLVGRRVDLGHDPLEPTRLVTLVPDITEREVWVCGPEPLIWAVVQACRGLGIPDRRIHLEEFAL